MRVFLRTLLKLVIIVSMPGTSWASTGHQWQDFVHACIDVIRDQDFDALEGFEPAPLSKGLPGVKEYAVFNHTSELVAIARLADGEWVHCVVHEREETSRSRFWSWPRHGRLPLSKGFQSLSSNG